MSDNEIRLLEKMLYADPNNKNVLQHLEALYERSGRKSDAARLRIVLRSWSGELSLARIKAAASLGYGPALSISPDAKINLSWNERKINRCLNILPNHKIVSMTRDWIEYTFSQLTGAEREDANKIFDKMKDILNSRIDPNSLTYMEFMRIFSSLCSKYYYADNALNNAFQSAYRLVRFAKSKQLMELDHVHRWLADLFDDEAAKAKVFRFQQKRLAEYLVQER